MSGHWFQRATGLNSKNSRRNRLKRRLLLQAMEARNLLAGDVMTHGVDSDTQLVSLPTHDGAIVASGHAAAHNGTDHGSVAHPDDPSKAAEHMAALQLADPAVATHTVVRSGDWTDPMTWSDQSIPGEDARILIPAGLTVNVDGLIAEEFHTIRVDGMLSFDPGTNTELRVDTLVSSPTGTLQMGTAQQPIDADVTARIVIADRGEIDRQWDPTGLSRGLILHGRTEIHGAAKNSWTTLAQPPRAGDTALVLTEGPDGWQVGDSLVIAGTQSDAMGDEVVTIASIEGTTIRLDQALELDHVPPAEDLRVHVANTSRNAVIESENSELDRRGHVMFMHNPDVQISYAGFYQLGRSDKLSELNLNEFDDEGQLIEGTGTNIRGRYSVHFHRQGVRAGSTPATVVGSAVVGSPGWGYVNHSSNVDFIDNVSYDVDGAAFNTESGDEVGSFINNLSIRTHGTGEVPVSRQGEGDYGHAGDGFWIQGGSGITIEGNVATGATGSGIIIYGEALIAEDQPETLFLAENLPDPALAGGAETVPVSLLLLRSVKNNQAYGSAIGLQMYYHRSPVVLDGASSVIADPQFPDSVIEDATVWNSAVGVKLNYTLDAQFKNVRVLNSADDPGQVGFDVSNVYNDSDHLYENLDLRGSEIGLKPSPNGQITVSGGSFANQTDIHVTLPRQNHRRLELTGDITFADLPADTMLNRDSRQNIVMDANPAILVDSSERWFLYHDQVILNHNEFGGQQLFYNEQAADHVPFPVQPIQVTPDDPGDPIGEQFIGTTNAEMQQLVGASLAGTLPTDDALDVPGDGIVGMIGSVADPPALLVEPFLLGQEFDDEDDGEQDDEDAECHEEEPDDGEDGEMDEADDGESEEEEPDEDGEDEELDVEESDEEEDDEAGDTNEEESDEEEPDGEGEDGEDEGDGGNGGDGDEEIDVDESDEVEDDDIDDMDENESDEEEPGEMDSEHGECDSELDESDEETDDAGEDDAESEAEEESDTDDIDDTEDTDNEIDLHNEDDPTDVNNDGATTALDALLVINFLLRQGPEFLQTVATALQFYVDVNGDRSASALDALQIINVLSRNTESVASVQAVDSAIGAGDLGVDEDDELLNLLSESQL